jgi:hypothetical protein
MTVPYEPIRRLPRFVGLLLAIGLVALAGLVLLGLDSMVGLTATVGSSPPGSTPRATVGAAAATPEAGPSLVPSSSVEVSPSVEVLPSPQPTSALDPPPAAGPFEIDLYEQGDFVSEVTKVTCVAAAMQTMMNIVDPGADTTRATQIELYRLARELSPPTLEGTGAEPEGWAEGLNERGYGPYAVDVQPSRGAAIAAAAKALRMTGRPVGLLTWRGAHSWVVSGFRATADPAWTDDFTVTHLFIEDVWYPRISSIWGESRPPDTLVPVKLMGEDYLPWRRPTHRYPDKDGKYVLILPVVEDGSG